MGIYEASNYYADIIYGTHKTLIASLGELDQNSSYYCEGCLSYDDAGHFPLLQQVWADYLGHAPHAPDEKNDFLSSLSDNLQQHYPSFAVTITPKDNSTKDNLYYTIKVKKTAK